jgi:hypothetical protein
MRWTVLALAGSCFISIAHAQPDKVLYELQERCGKRAAEVFQKEWGGHHIAPINNDDGYLTADYENHYSPRLNKCFYLQKSNSVSKSMGIQSLELYDLNDNRQIGNFTTGTRLGITECQVQGKSCRSEQEWRELARPFLEE